jgi:phosphate transport system permease protein
MASLEKTSQVAGGVEPFVRVIADTMKPGLPCVAIMLVRRGADVGLSVLAGSVVLGIMILPTVISISIDSILAVPQTYREGSLALGATTWQTIHMVIVKAARSGIIASIILAMGRALGETMAVIMVAGNTVKIPHTPLDSVRTLTANIALEMSYATGLHRQALFATGVVLFIIIMFLNVVAHAVSRQGARKGAPR